MLHFENFRKSSTVPIGFEDFYWCPDPKAVDSSQQNLFTAGGNIGKCNNYLIPFGEQYKTTFSIIYVDFLNYS